MTERTPKPDDRRYHLQRQPPETLQEALIRLRASFVVLWHEIIRSPIGALMSRLIFMVLGRLVALIGRK